MKFGSFLFGGLVGAAAVVYLNNKSKSMLFSAFSSNNQSVGNMMEKAKDKFNITNTAAENKAGNKAASSTAFKKDDAFSAGGLGKVEEIVKQDPELKVAVEEILAHNQEKEVLHTQ